MSEIAAGNPVSWVGKKVAKMRSVENISVLVGRSDRDPSPGPGDPATA